MSSPVTHSHFSIHLFSKIKIKTDAIIYLILERKKENHKKNLEKGERHIYIFPTF